MIRLQSPSELRSSAPVGSVTLPSFWIHDPALRFVRAENKFRTHGITEQSRRHEYAVDALPPRAASEVRDSSLDPPSNERAVVRRLTDSEERRIRRLPSAEELGDRRPSRFLRRVEQLLDHRALSLDAAIVRELFLQRLPSHVRTILAVARQLPLAELAETTDSITESSPAPSINATHRATGVGDEIAQLRRAVERLSAQVADLRRRRSVSPRSRHPFHSARRSPSPHRRRSPGRPAPRPPNPDPCYHHRRFGADARKCRAPRARNRHQGNETASF